MLKVTHITHAQTELVPEDVMLLQIQEDCTCQ